MSSDAIPNHTIGLSRKRSGRELDGEASGGWPGLGNCLMRGTLVKQLENRAGFFIALVRQELRRGFRSTPP